MENRDIIKDIRAINEQQRRVYIAQEKLNKLSDKVGTKYFNMHSFPAEDVLKSLKDRLFSLAKLGELVDIGDTND